MSLFNDILEYISVGMDQDGNAKRAVDKDRASSSGQYSYVAYGGAGHSFLTVPAGKVARLLNVVITNKELTDANLVLKDAATQMVATIGVAKAASAYGNTVVLDESDLRGYKFATSIIGVVNCVGHANDVDVSIAWWIDPQMTE